MKNLNIFQIDAFTDKPFEGNPAAVTFGDGLQREEMQSIAKEMNLAETAFLSSSTKADYNLKWFTPSTEVELCGHATIASLHFLKENNLLKYNSDILFDTLSGILKCGMKEGRYFMQIPVYSMEEFKGDEKEIMDSLGIEGKDIDNSVPFLLMENKNLYIYIKTLKALKNINPDFKALKKLTETKNEFSGAALFTKETIDKNSFAHGRYFAPFYGIDEDPVTGSMNGPLLLVLKRLGFIDNNEKEINLIFEQGDFIGRRGRVAVNYNPKNNELYISGKAITVLKGVLTF